MEKYLSNLIDNGFDFLEKAIAQFKTEPKYSVINFCVAIELFLKARLMGEHWSLIVAHDPNLLAFKNGDFKSLNFRELVPKIESVTGEKIEKDAVQCFNGLANHRNKMLHFFHEAHIGATSDVLLEKIALEQCAGWFHLQRLLRKWDSIFEDYAEKVAQINRLMKEHKIYLDTVFEKVRPEIESAKLKGIEFRKCQRCKKGSSEISKISEFLFSTKCRVCLYTDDFIRIPCSDDDCDGNVKIDGNDAGGESFSCSKCDEEISLKDLEAILDNDTTDPIDYVTTNCAECSFPGNVIMNDEYYICMNCFYVSDYREICDSCNEGQIGGGDLEDSYYNGCDSCDGVSRFKDD